MQQCWNDDGKGKRKYSYSHNIQHRTIQKALLTGKCVRGPLDFTIPSTIRI
jgi:hypothetical protein